jgi:flagellar protein FliO/FliZ
MGRASTINVVRIADRVLVVGATEEQVTLLAEMDGEAVDEALRERQTVVRRLPAAGTDGPQHAAVARGSGLLSGTVLDRQGWGTFVQQMRERTVRRP